MEKYKTQIRFAIVILISLIVSMFVGQIILPFILGLFLAYISNSSIKKMQRIIRNRNIAVTVFLFVVVFGTPRFLCLFQHCRRLLV